MSGFCRLYVVPDTAGSIPQRTAPANVTDSTVRASADEFSISNIPLGASNSVIDNHDDPSHATYVPSLSGIRFPQRSSNLYEVYIQPS